MTSWNTFSHSRKSWAIEVMKMQTIGHHKIPFLSRLWIYMTFNIRPWIFFPTNVGKQKSYASFLGHGNFILSQVRWPKCSIKCGIWRLSLDDTAIKQQCIICKYASTYSETVSSSNNTNNFSICQCSVPILSIIPIRFKKSVSAILPFGGSQGLWIGRWLPLVWFRCWARVVLYVMTFYSSIILTTWYLLIILGVYSVGLAV